MPQLRAIIIDDNKKTRGQVQSVLPDYVESVAAGSAEGALDYLKRDANGELPDFVILNGDDPKSFGLYVFDWMINRSDDPEIAAIPVIVLTQDEFSDKSLEFLEIGDVTFYAGDIDETELFTVINDAMEKADFMPYPEEPVYEETKNIDRLMGQSVKAPEGDQRALVLDMESKIVNLELALARGRKRVEDIKTVLEAAQNKNSAGDDEFFGRRRGKEKSVVKEDKNALHMSSFLEKARKKTDAEERVLEGLKRASSPSQVIKKTQADPNEGAGHVVKRSEQQAPEPGFSDSINRLRQKALENPGGAFNAQGTIKVEDRPKHESAKPAYATKRTIVIVDDDLKTRKLCTLFLTQNYNVVPLDSGMKTIDYFVKSRADLLLINPMLPGMSGMATVASLRNQPGCATLPVMFLVGDNYTEPRAALMGPFIVGILNKPITQGLIAQSVAGFFDNYDKAAGRYF